MTSSTELIKIEIPSPRDVIRLNDCHGFAHLWGILAILHRFPRPNPRFPKATYYDRNASLLPDNSRITQPFPPFIVLRPTLRFSGLLMPALGTFSDGLRRARIKTQICE